MTTLTDLRALLERALTHAENPAIVRLTDRTVEGLARAYLPRSVSWCWAWSLHIRHDGALTDLLSWVADNIIAVAVAPRPVERAVKHLDLTDPGTAHALLVALALALGLDPGVGGVGCMWGRCGTYGRWELATLGGYRTIVMDRRSGHTAERSRIRHLFAPSVAAEPDPIKALALAVRHVLENP